MRLAIYLADPSLRAAVLAWAEGHGHAVLECLPAPPTSWAGVDHLFALEAAVARLEPAAVLLDPDLLTRARQSSAGLAAVRAILGLPDGVDLPAAAFLPPALGAPPRGRPAVVLFPVASVGEAAAALADLGEESAAAATGRGVPAAGGASGAKTGDAHPDALRLIHHDGGYARQRAAARLHRPDPALLTDPAAWARVLTGEEGRFVLMLQTNHRQPWRRSAARVYLEALTAAEAAFEEEMAYRLHHGSWKVFWLREHACRLCAVIAHLLAGVEVGHLPPPVPPLEGHRFLHWRCPVSFLYPVAAILRQVPNPTLSPLLAELFQVGFEPGRQGDEAWIADQALRLWGLCGFLRAAARAHLDALDLCLEPGSSFLAADEAGPLPRALGVLLEFWGWHGLLSLGSGVARTAVGVLAGTTFVAGADGADPLGRAAFPYLVFADAMARAAEDATPPTKEGTGGGDTSSAAPKAP